MVLKQWRTCRSMLLDHDISVGIGTVGVQGENTLTRQVEVAFALC